jgi:HEAT repeat protein
MKKGVLILTAFLFAFCGTIYAETNTEDSSTAVEKKTTKYTKTAEVPAAKRPRKPTEDELLASAEKDEANNTDEYVKKCNDTFAYGLESEISDLIDELTTNGDMRFVDEIYDLFQETKNPAVKQKILSYFTKLKDPCLEDYAVSVINDPYDEKKDTVAACFKYVAAVDCKEANPGAVALVDKEDEDFFDEALTCLGEIGGADEAEFLADYLDRDDLTTSQKQALMKVLGRIKAVETFDKIASIAQNQDENSFVRMYAAEAIGAMEKPEAEPILAKLFEEDDPNFRVYVIKGIAHYHDKTADDVIMQGLRDSQYKVRLESVNAVKDRKMTDAVPYIIYRSKDKSEESVVKDACYKALGELNTKEGNDYLVSVITDKKVGDNTKAKVATVLLEYNAAGTDEIIALAEETLKNDARKSLRFSLGKDFAKYGRPEYAKICAEFIASADVSTQGTGLDIFAKGRYSSVRPAVEAIAKDADEPAESATTTPAADSAKGKMPAKKKTPNANAKKAKRILQQIDSLYGKDSATSTNDSTTDANGTGSSTGSTATSASDSAAEK